MAWGTRELAELAGTTVKAVRHYHSIGLLEEPARASNGYKQYQPHHLVRLLRIIRLKELGIPLARIAELDTDEGFSLAEVDAELARRIARLEQLRSELVVLIAHQASAVAPAPFEPVFDDLPERDRSLLTVYSKVFEQEQLADLKQLILERGDADDEFELLPADADEETIKAIAADLAVVIREHQTRFPWLSDSASASKLGSATANALIPTVAQMYNPAQLKALALAYSTLENSG